jgi:hypothetical protein
MPLDNQLAPGRRDWSNITFSGFRSGSGYSSKKSPTSAQISSRRRFPITFPGCSERRRPRLQNMPDDLFEEVPDEKVDGEAFGLSFRRNKGLLFGGQFDSQRHILSRIMLTTQTFFL